MALSVYFRTMCFNAPLTSFAPPLCKNKCGQASVRQKQTIKKPKDIQGTIQSPTIFHNMVQINKPEEK